MIAFRKPDRSRVRGGRAGMLPSAVLLALAAAGCQKQGPAQTAGKQVDKSIAKVGDKIDDAADKLRK